MRLAWCIVAIAGCGGSCGLDLERMGDQPKYTAYEACDVCPEGTIMMQPPAHTVRRDAVIAPTDVAQGRAPGGGWVDAIPMAVDAPLLVRGRSRFDIYCAACHGRLGNGISKVAENMALRPPPNLLGPPYDTYPPGRIYAVISEGFGLMRSYAVELDLRDRWAVVAYLQVLQLAQHVALSELPPDRQEEAKRWLK